MRVLHTADWHLGKTLEGRSRIPEQEAFIDELCEMVRRENVDLLMLAGDVFDVVNPPAKAEELFYDALERLSEGGQRAIVVIAGNHDNPERLRAANPLATRQGILLLGYPTDTPRSHHDHVLELASSPSFISLRLPRVHHPVSIAALPYPSEARLNQVLAQEFREDALQLAYAERVRSFWDQLDTKWPTDAVCLAMSHLFMIGGTESGSERPIQLGGAYAVPADIVPTKAQYLALGHLHRAQSVQSSPILTRYAGSPLAYSFAEAHQVKSVTLLDVVPGEAPSVEEIPISAGKPLVRWEATAGLAQVESWCEQGRDSNAWVELRLHVTESLNPSELQRLLRLHAGLLLIKPVYVGDPVQYAVAERENLPMDTLFREFYMRQTGGATPNDDVMALFLELVADEQPSEVPIGEEVSA